MTRYLKYICLFVVIQTILFMTLGTISPHQHEHTPTPKTEQTTKSKTKKHHRKHKRKHKKKGFLKSILWGLLLILLIGGVLLLLILPWFINLSVWFFVSVISILIITGLLIKLINDQSDGPRWMKPISDGIQGCLSAVVILLAIGALIIVGTIAIFGPVGIVYLCSLISFIGFLIHIGESIGDRKRRKRIEKKNSTKPATE